MFRFLSLVWFSTGVLAEDDTSLLQSSMRRNVEKHTGSPWKKKDGSYVQEGHGDTSECYETLRQAKAKCLQAADCLAVATQSNVCHGMYRITHGGPTFKYYSSWAAYNLTSWELKSRDTATDVIDQPWFKRPGYYVTEGHGKTDECYQTLSYAQAKCLQAADCLAVATQSNVCGGMYRVTHGGPTFKYYSNWAAYKLAAWELESRELADNTIESPWFIRPGYYVVQGHGTTNECYNTLNQAKAKCLEAADCKAVATQKNVCHGMYRITHGGPTFKYYSNWAAYDLKAWELESTVLANNNISTPWFERRGYYVLEGHGSSTECYSAIGQAKAKCLEAGDCHAVATQSNVCGGMYRVTHGGPTFKYYSNWAAYSLKAWELESRDLAKETIRGLWVHRLGYYVMEGHGKHSECYDTVNQAKAKCRKAGDCHAVATQSNVCGGMFRVTHGGPTFKYYGNWKAYNLSAWELQSGNVATQGGVVPQGTDVEVMNVENTLDDEAVVNIAVDAGNAAIMFSR